MDFVDDIGAYKLQPTVSRTRKRQISILPLKFISTNREILSKSPVYQTGPYVCD